MSVGSSIGPSGTRRAAQVIIVSSVMFSFISYWRTAAIVLCDMSSTAYYIGAIVETAIGKAAPWFIVAVLLFSYAMRAVYIESSALFIRGGVYRVVKEAMGGFLAKISVSALLFDYVLTGPISGVSAGQYIVGLLLEACARFGIFELDEGIRQSVKGWGSVVIACCVTIYFFRQNLRGIPESSDKALKIMLATTVMGVVMLTWCVATLAIRGPVNSIPSAIPDLNKKLELDEAYRLVPRINPITGEQEDPLGFLNQIAVVAEPVRHTTDWLSLVGLVGIVIAFGHSILAMSGEETLAQVYREVEAPKLRNFRRAAFIVFAYSLILTGSMNFLAVLLIPDKLRMGEYFNNWIGGLAMQLAGPMEARLLLNAFVVLVGFLILSGAVNTSIIGSNGVLCRVAEDGVLPSWFLKPHRKFGTTFRLLYFITGLQLVTIIASRGNVILLGEAYAFGVVWSFVFNSVSMVLLRFKDPSPREFKMPLNVRYGAVEIPVGLMLVALVVLTSAVSNLFCKPVATIGGVVFTLVFLTFFSLTDWFYGRRRRATGHEHVHQFNRETAEEPSREQLGLTLPYCKLVAIRSPQNLFMLETALAESDPLTTQVVVMTAKAVPPDFVIDAPSALDAYDQRLMTAVVDRAERAGKTVNVLITPTNNPLYAVLRTAKELSASELIIGVSNKFSAQEQIDQIALYWTMSLHAGEPAPLTVRIVSRDREVTFDLAGGRRIPKISERRARSVDELRAAGIGVDRVLLIHDDTSAGSDLFQAVLTLLDPHVALDLACLPRDDERLQGESGTLEHDRQQAAQLKRELTVHKLPDASGEQIVRLARERRHDVIVIPIGAGISSAGARYADWVDQVLRNAHCPVFLAVPPKVPEQVDL